jgi:PilZ domain-containing protein
MPEPNPAKPEHLEAARTGQAREDGRPKQDRPNKERPEEDRRRSTRFSVGGYATIHCLPSEGVSIAGTIRDLSLHGCCIDTPLRLDSGVRAEILVRVNASSFRALGEVRAIRGLSGAGVEFVQLSAGGRDLLANTMAQLARVQAAMNRLRASRREMDAELLRKQLEAGELQAAFLRLGSRFALEDMKERANVSGAEGDGMKLEEEPLVIPVNLFG